MACLQNGTSLLNNNNLSSFKYNILKYDEARSNMWSNSSQINSFLNKNCQLPFRNNNPTKDKPISDHIFKDQLPSTQTDEVCEKQYPAQFEETESDDQKDILQSNPAMCVQEDFDCKYYSNKVYKTNESVKSRDLKQLQSENKPLKETTLTSNKKNVQTFEDDSSYQKELPIDGSSASFSEYDSNEPSHHARRPMNAFLIFCKRHRTVVKNRYPHLENRAVTKILGEWWAALETEEKASYTELAKQYKNAFFSANPNFKWYKLPAPPLRTLNTRPGNIVKISPQKADVEVEEKPQQLFTPGKLADETQLGSITSLINSDNQHTIPYTTVKPDIITATTVKTEEPDELDDEISVKSEYKNYLLSPPTSTVKMNEPVKPLKKRIVQSHKDNKNIVRSIFNEPETTEKKMFDSSLLDLALEDFVETVENEDAMNTEEEEEEEERELETKRYALNTNSNLTQQEIIDKVVDHICSSRNESGDSGSLDKEEYDCNICLQNQESKFKETRKSVRSCKGLRYAKFMAEGKLFVNKRTKKQQLSTASKLPKPSSSQNTNLNAIDKVPRNNESIELNETIKKLTERTVGSTAKNNSNLETSEFIVEQMKFSSEYSTDQLASDMRAENVKKMFKAADFNLDEKIEALPSLSLDKFQQKKRESKKRKFLRATKHKDTPTEYNKTETNKQKAEINNDNTAKYNSLTGSRKRKPRKQSITRLDPLHDASKQNIASSTATTNNATANIDLFGLATLAEVAAKKAKIDQQQQK